MNSKGQVDWKWHAESPSSEEPTYIPEKGDVWGNRARAMAVLGHQAMVCMAYLKGNSPKLRTEKVNVLRDSGATRNFVHPAEAERRGLTSTPAVTPLRVTLGDGKEVTCNRTTRLKLVFKSYTYTTDAYLLDMGTNPDCTVILGTVWLATLGDYTCNEARGTSYILLKRKGEV